MLATPELIREAEQRHRLDEKLPRWLNRGLYRQFAASTAKALGQLPVITKADLRSAFPHDLLPPDLALDDLTTRQVVELEYTSGTSEDRLPVVFGRTWWNEQEERALRLNQTVARVFDASPNPRRATITTPACNGLTCPTVWASQSQRTFGNALFVNLARIPFVLTEAELQRMADEIAVWQPQFLDLDPVHGAWFALFCERKEIRFPSLHFVMCSYEFVSVVHRRILERAFGVPVFNLYGSTETGHLLMENERGEMKPSYETAWLELTEVDSSGIGTLLVSTLSNDYMPLLRYRIGDLAERVDKPYGTDYIVHGRIRDALTLTNDRRITTWQVDQCFRGINGLAHYQLRPTADGQFRLRYVAEGSGPDAHDLKELQSNLQQLLHVPVETEATTTLVPEASGKFRLTSD